MKCFSWYSCESWRWFSVSCVHQRDGVRNRLKLKDKPDERCDVQQHKHVSVWFDCVVGGETLVTFHLHSKPLTHTQKHEPWQQSNLILQLCVPLLCLVELQDFLIWKTEEASHNQTYSDVNVTLKKLTLAPELVSSYISDRVCDAASCCVSQLDT